jgi:hypothetical protein
MMLIMVMVVTHNLKNRTQEEFFHQKGATESFSRTSRKKIPEFQNIFWKTKGLQDWQELCCIFGASIKEPSIAVKK